MESDPLSAERVTNARSAVMRRAAMAKTGYAPLVEPLSEQCAESVLAALALAKKIMALQIVEICTLGETNHWHAGPEVTQGQRVRIVPVADGENGEAAR